MIGRITGLTAALLLAVAGCSSGPSASNAPLQTADVDAIGLGAYAGDVLILDFWAVW